MQINKDNISETLKVSGKSLLGVVKNIIKEGNIRKMTISTKDGKVLAEFPLTIGVIGAALAPVLAIVAAIGVLVKDCVISVEKVNTDKSDTEITN